MEEDIIIGSTEIPELENPDDREYENVEIETEGGKYCRKFIIINWIRAGEIIHIQLQEVMKTRLAELLDVEQLVEL